MGKKALLLGIIISSILSTVPALAAKSTKACEKSLLPDYGRTSRVPRAQARNRHLQESAGAGGRHSKDYGTWDTNVSPNIDNDPI